MADAISREQMRVKVKRMFDRIKQRKDGPYKAGYVNACRDALAKLDECDSMRLEAVTLCKDCKNATERNTTLPYCIIHNRRKAPEDYCNYGKPDME